MLIKVGGCIALSSILAIVLQNITFVSCQATNGGAVSVAQSELMTHKCYFKRNFAIGSGGALFVAGSSVVTSLNDVYTHNGATMSGGSVSVEGASRVTFKKAQMMYSGAMQGGSVSAFTQSSVTLLNSSISMSKAYVQGGGIMIMDSALHIVSTLVISNDAPQGVAQCQIEQFPIIASS